MMRQVRKSDKREATLVQVLSLYLLLLAFFVLLYNQSRVEGARSLAVAGSLQSTFSNKGKKFDQPLPLTSMLADSLAEARFQSAMGHLVQTEIPIAEVDIVNRGRLLRARMPSNELFDPGSAAIRDDRGPMIRRIAKSLADHPPGVRYDVEVLFDGGWITPKMLGRQATLEIRRATSIAVALVAAGAPEGSVAVGIRQGSASWIGLDFHVRSEEESRMTLPVPSEGDRGRKR